MFSVHGWSVPSAGPKTETTAPSRKPSQQPHPDQQNKRKRQRSSTSTGTVTTDNVADLWEAVVEGRKERNGGTGEEKTTEEGGGGADVEKAQTKRRKRTRNRPDKDGGSGSGQTGPRDQPSPGASRPKEEEKEGRGQRRAGPPSPLPPPPPPPPPPPTGPAAAPEKSLTPLQRSMRDKLISARFRHLNESLYTRPSWEAYCMFQQSPETFSEYHEGFRRQVQVWPENPVDGYIATIRDRGRKKTLPRTGDTCTVADLGCGDARLGQAMQPEKRRLRVEVLSFDLHGTSPLVTRADIAALPLADGSVDVAIFCLALMGTNWVDFVEEAYRVLRWKGELWVAEIKSRFGKGAAGARDRAVAHAVGKKGGYGGAVNRKTATGAVEADVFEEDPTADHDGKLSDTRHQTDVGAFVDVLRTRGFLLSDGGGAESGGVDMSNKMFVKIDFIKSGHPTRGKGATRYSSGRGDGGGNPAGGDDADESGREEGRILKPCVYKPR